MRTFFCVSIGLLLTACGPSIDSDSAKAGELVFQRNCAACHVTEIAPTLNGIIGRRAGSLDSFAYSDAMKQSGIVWDKETVAAFLQDPNAVVEGTNMAFAGLNEEEANNVAEYLRSQ